MPDHHRHHHHYHLHEYPDPEYVYNPQHDYYGPDPGPGYPEVAQEPANGLPQERGLAKDHRPAPLDLDSYDADYDPRDKHYLSNDEDQPRFEPSLASEPSKSRSRRRSSTHNHHHDDDRRHSRHCHFSPDQHYDSASRRGRSPPPPLSRLSGGPFPYREGSRSSSLETEDPVSTTITPTGRGRGASATRRSSVSRPAALRDVELAATAAAAAAAATAANAAASDRRSRRGSARDVAGVDRAATASPRGHYYPPSASRAKSVANRSSAPSRRFADDGDEDRDHDNDRSHDHRPRGPRRRSSSTTSVDTRRRAELPPSSASRSRSIAERPRGRESSGRRRRSGSVDGIVTSLRTHEDMIVSIAKCVAEAGALAAVKFRHDKSPWIGAKGTKVAAAAIGGGMVDVMVGHEMAKGVRKGGIGHAVLKQAAAMALESMILKPAAKGTRFEREA